MLGVTSLPAPWTAAAPVAGLRISVISRVGKQSAPRRIELVFLMFCDFPF